MSKFVTKPVPAAPPDVAEIIRPWGRFRQPALNRECTVSLMTVLPGRRLSLQSHAGRAELWIVLDSGAEVQIGDERIRPPAGAELWIPAQVRHRLSCVGDAPVRVLEVAFGNWQQDDITRFADDFDRPARGE